MPTRSRGSGSTKVRPAIREADLGHANAVDGTLPSREMSKAVHG